MKTQVQINSIEEFDDVTNILHTSIKRIEDNFNLEKNKMMKLNGDKNVLSSKSQRSLNEKYIQLNELYPSIVESLNNFAKFLNETSANYKAFERSTNQSVEQNLSNLNVNTQ